MAHPEESELQNLPQLSQGQQTCSPGVPIFSGAFDLQTLACFEMTPWPRKVDIDIAAFPFVASGDLQKVASKGWEMPWMGAGRCLLVKVQFLSPVLAVVTKGNMMQHAGYDYLPNYNVTSEALNQEPQWLARCNRT